MHNSYQSRMRTKEKARRNSQLSIAARLKLPGVKISIKCTPINEEPIIIEGFLCLADLSPLGMTVFLEEALVLGSDASITLEEPRQFYVKGSVISCQNYLKNSKVIFESPRAFRATLRFRFESSEEADEVRRYCQYVYSEVMQSKPKAA